MNIFTHVKKTFLISAFVLFGWSLGAMAHAAQITFTAAPIAPAAGEEFTIAVRLSTQDDSLNAVEGSVSVPKDIAVKNVSTGGSVLSLWPAQPRFVPGSGKVEFTGGVPAGVPAGADMLLFTITAVASAPGSYTFALDSARGFRDDGKGTGFMISGLQYKVSVGTQASAPAPQEKDTTAPQFISVEVGQDPALFDGRRYLTFFATDDQSGVNYYEVKEGWFSRYTKADRYYVLSDQEQRFAVWVRAVDQAGNRTAQKIPSQHPDYSLVYWGGGILLIVAIVFVQYLRRPRQ